MNYAHLKFLIEADFCLKGEKKGKLIIATDKGGHVQLSGFNANIFLIKTMKFLFK